jgi:hypothetical protein
MGVGLAIFIALAALVIVSVVLSRRRKKLMEELGIEKPKRGAAAPPPLPTFDVVRPRPPVTSFHVDGDAATVQFDVPLSEAIDPILSEVLLDEAIEVVREKSQTLPISGVTQVVVLAGRGETREVTRTRLEHAGQLPPRTQAASILNLSAIAPDPLADNWMATGTIPDTAARVPEDKLGPVGAELQIPKAIDTGLRTQGIDPLTAGPADLLTGILRMFGYSISSSGPGAFYADRAGERTFILEDRYAEGDYTEMDPAGIRRFLAEFEGSKAAKGILVSDKFAPFEIYEWERREPRIRFIPRERMQRVIDTLALS